MDWTNISTEDAGEQYRFHVPGTILADLWHYQYAEWDEQKDGWRLNLATYDTDGGFITRDHERDEPLTETEAKAWAEPLVQQFMQKARAV